LTGAGADTIVSHGYAVFLVGVESSTLAATPGPLPPAPDHFW
jgi:hypothetical protein